MSQNQGLGPCGLVISLSDWENRFSSLERLMRLQLGGVRKTVHARSRAMVAHAVPPHFPCLGSISRRRCGITRMTVRSCEENNWVRREVRMMLSVSESSGRRLVGSTMERCPGWYLDLLVPGQILTLKGPDSQRSVCPSRQSGSAVSQRVSISGQSC